MTLLEKKILLLKHKGDPNWLNGDDCLNFVDSSDNDTDVLLYYNDDGNYRDSAFICSALVKDDKKDCFNQPSNWIFENGWNWWTIYNGKKCSKVISKEFEDVEPIYFVRYFDGRTDAENKTYLDVYQKVLHILDLHYVPHKNAYCLYDDLGGLIEVIKYVKNSTYEYMTIKQKYLNIYLHACGLTLVKFFDFMRLGKEDVVLDWNVKNVDKDGFKFAIGKAENSLYLRGIKIIKKDPLAEEIKQYVDFLIYDFKNEKQRVYSCAPSGLCNYFNWNTNDYPHDLSVAFFNADVLNKYRTNPDKYRVFERHIDCKGWELRSYDINEDGLVHAYLVDLSKLPYNEQLYWKSFNVAPPMSGRLGGISKRAWTNDFEGKFSEEESLQQKINRIIDELKKHQFWNIDTNASVDVFIDENSKTWASSIANLYNIFIHRIQTNKIKHILITEFAELEETIKEEKSISLLKRLCKHKQVDVRILAVLDEIRIIRNTCDSHISQSERDKLIDKAKTDYSSLQEHYKNLLERLAKTATELQNILPKS